MNRNIIRNGIMYFLFMAIGAGYGFYNGRLSRKPDITYSNPEFTISYTVTKKELIEEYGKMDLADFVRKNGIEMYIEIINPELKEEFRNINNSATILKYLVLEQREKEESLDDLFKDLLPEGMEKDLMPQRISLPQYKQHPL